MSLPTYLEWLTSQVWLIAFEQSLFLNLKWKTSPLLCFFFKSNPHYIGDGKISVLELKSALNTIDDERSDEEIKEMINKADPSVDGNTEISFSEFMGVRSLYFWLKLHEFVPFRNSHPSIHFYLPVNIQLCCRWWLRQTFTFFSKVSSTAIALHGPL